MERQATDGVPRNNGVGARSTVVVQAFTRQGSAYM